MKLYVWGTGRLAGKVVGKWIEPEKITAFIDNNKNQREYMGIPVISPGELIEYDAIVVANLYSKEIYTQCKNVGIDVAKMIFVYENCELEDLNKDYKFVAEILGDECAKTIKERYHVVRGVESTAESISREGYYQTDYVRMKVFEMTVKEIKKRGLEGEVAEVGVYRGEFAQFINKAFPQKNCYLFDTFGGFDDQEALNEINAGNATKSFVEAYKKTQLGDVIEKMPYKEKIRVKQGYFPESLDGLEEKWCFVSIDVDFEKSIYNALEYFYPRLVKGGYIFVHDYSSDLFGVEKAVDDFERKCSVMLSKVPLCDANGTLVITK